MTTGVLSPVLTVYFVMFAASIRRPEWSTFNLVALTSWPGATAAERDVAEREAWTAAVLGIAVQN